MTENQDALVWAELDQAPGQDAKSVAEQTGLSRIPAHASLKRLCEAGEVVWHGHHPRVWASVGPTSDAKVEITSSDAWLVCHPLRWMLAHDQVGEPTRELLSRIEQASS